MSKGGDAQSQLAGARHGDTDRPLTVHRATCTQALVSTAQAWPAQGGMQHGVGCLLTTAQGEQPDGQVWMPRGVPFVCVVRLAAEPPFAGDISGSGSDHPDAAVRCGAAERRGEDPKRL